MSLALYLPLAFEVCVYGFKMFRYIKEPGVREYARKEVEERRGRGECFSKLKTYRFLYLPYPLDSISSVNSEAMRKIFYK